MSDTVFLVDCDRRFMAAALRCLRQAQLTAVGFGSAQDFLDGYDAAQPGCLVTDACMPGISGLQLARRLEHHRCPLPVVFVSRCDDVPTAVCALKRGAVDFLQKPVRPAALVDSVRLALVRDRRARARAAERDELEVRYARLTQREREVFASLATDETAKRIAARLNISPRTAEHHRERVIDKMEARSWHELIVMAIMLGHYQPRLPWAAAAATLGMHPHLPAEAFS